MKKQSAGLLVYRKSSPVVEVLLIHPGGPFFVKKDVWGIPKGEFEPGENPLAVARREFQEEIGQAAPDGEAVPLGDIKRSDGKVITAWAVEGDCSVEKITSNLFELEWPPRSGKIQQFPEVDAAKWFTLDQTAGKMHKGQEIFITRLADHLGLDHNELQPGPELPKPGEQGALF